MQVTPSAADTTSSARHADGEQNSDLQLSAPGQLRVIKRNGTLVPYTDDKIRIAMTKAFLAVEGSQAAASSRATAPDPEHWKQLLPALTSI